MKLPELPEINKKVGKAIKSLQKWEEKKGTLRLFMNGKYEEIPITRRYTDRHVSLCIRETCDAEGKCCHYFEKDNIGFCHYAESYYDIMYKGSVVIASDLTPSKEQEFFEEMNHILEEIYRRKEDE